MLDCRSITNVLIETKITSNDLSLITQPKQLTPREIQIYIKLLRNSVLSLDVYLIHRLNTKNATNLQNQKEEKEVIENLGIIFSHLNAFTLQEIFTKTIDFRRIFLADCAFIHNN